MNEGVTGVTACLKNERPGPMKPKRTTSYDLIHVLMSMCFLVALPVSAAIQVNTDESLVVTYTLPDPLKCEDGTFVRDISKWNTVRRPELLQLFSEHCYGRTPVFTYRLRAEVTATVSNAVGGLAIREMITLSFFDDPTAPKIEMVLYLPRNASGPVPVFLGLNYYGNASVEPDQAIALSQQWMRPTREMGIVNNRATEETRGKHSSRWPLELALKRGYAVATYYYGDMEPDHINGWKTGLRGYLLRQAGRAEPASDDWGAIGVWAWGLSRCLDYLVSNPSVDAGRVIVFGHSRQGKTALWAGAQDIRFAMVVSNDSGEGGAALHRRNFGETIADSVRLSSYWYCANYKHYTNNVDALPVDAHELVALSAPRPVCIGSATQDTWADPKGEFLSGVHAGPVYRLFGYEGLGTTDWPAPDHPVGRRISYHLRTGKHDITAYDWEQYLNFADRHLKRQP